jgi:hypothetical protein
MPTRVGYEMKRLLLSALAVSALLIGSAEAQQPNIVGVNAQTGTSYTFVNTDCGKLVTFTNASAIAVTLPQASTPAGGGGGSGFFYPGCTIMAISAGAGTATITPTTSTIAGASTLALATTVGAIIVSDGTNYHAFLSATGSK